MMFSNLEHKTFDREDRIRASDLGEMLGYVKKRGIKAFIDRNQENLLWFGEIIEEATAAATAGRPSTEYWLNEEQAMLLIFRSETKNARALAVEAINMISNSGVDIFGEIIAGADERADDV